MKYLWQGVSAVCLIWACIATALYIQARSNPLIMNVSTANEGAESQTLLQMERVSFVRQFVEKYTSFESETFWQEQTVLSFLMTPSLREQRLAEISRLKEKILRNHTIQKGQIEWLQESAEGYIVQIDISLSEGSSVLKLKASLSLELESTHRSLENPWGLLVSGLQFAKLETRKSRLFTGEISMLSGMPGILHFPCAVENFEIPPGSPIRVKITTLNVSEIQIFLDKPISEKLPLRALCKEQEFALSLSSVEKDGDLYIDIPLEISRKREKLVKAPQKRSNVYKKTIENELGFVIEE